MSRRADYIDSELLTGWGDLDTPPVDMPVIRADVPLKPSRVQIERRTDWPTDALASGCTEPDELPASCSYTSINGERVIVALGLVVLVCWGLMALVGSVTDTDVLAYLLGDLQ